MLISLQASRQISYKQTRRVLFCVVSKVSKYSCVFIIVIITSLCLGWIQVRLSHMDSVLANAMYVYVTEYFKEDSK